MNVTDIPMIPALVVVVVGLVLALFGPRLWAGLRWMARDASRKDEDE